MIKVVTETVQERDAAVRSSSIIPGRGPDERAVLVSERSAVWDRRSPGLPPLVDDAVDLGPLGAMPESWAHDLVHCRLVRVSALMRRLPRAKVPAGYRSLLGLLQPEEPGIAPRPLSTEEERCLDWTWARVNAWSDTDRAIVMGMMSGQSLRKIAKITQRLAWVYGIGKAIGKDTVRSRYLEICRTMAAEWIGAGEQIDRATRECWLALASKK